MIDWVPAVALLVIVALVWLWGSMFLWVCLFGFLAWWRARKQ